MKQFETKSTSKPSYSSSLGELITPLTLMSFEDDFGRVPTWGVKTERITDCCNQRNERNSISKKNGRQSSKQQQEYIPVCISNILDVHWRPRWGSGYWSGTGRPQPQTRPNKFLLKPSISCTDHNDECVLFCFAARNQVGQNLPQKEVPQNTISLKYKKKKPKIKEQSVPSQCFRREKDYFLHHTSHIRVSKVFLGLSPWNGYEVVAEDSLSLPDGIWSLINIKTRLNQLLLFLPSSPSSPLLILVGVPKLYKCLSQRYPAAVQSVSETSHHPEFGGIMLNVIWEWIS